MRASPQATPTTTGPIILLGAGDAAMAALWRLAATGAQIRWYADRPDVAAEIALASGLGGGLELRFDDPRDAPLDGATAVVAARGDALDLDIAERARAIAVPVEVIGRPDVSTFSTSDRRPVTPMRRFFARAA